MGAFLTADVEHALVRQGEHGLEGERRFADARFTAKEHDAARHESATQHAVQFVVVHIDARVVLG